jgi:hypothetical protein
MATEDSGTMLLDCYQRYIGELDEVTPVDVYLGGGLTMGGLALAVAGWLVFLWNELAATHGTPGFYTVREVAVVAAGLGIPVFLLGVVTMLLGSDRVTVLAGVGVAACVGAVLLFVATYPGQWDAASQFNAPVGVTLYGLGAATLVFAAGAAYSCRVTGTLQFRDAGTGPESD